MKEIKTESGTLAFFNEDDILLEDPNSFLEIVFSTSSETIVFSKSNFHEKFYELKSGFAGEILQKITNYKLRMIILGDFSGYESKSFKDFVYESNQNGKVIFISDLEAGLKLLK
ncbi:hypothetical protein A0128_20555 [Leptospira tipperaryensis]|uniref:DUF4180 domain-containing protein n=1 Tax=Leptospira tipperaryensis TaxID=2564040 RepID=A0A1D7V3K2_9LEPT|nr:DUF4180 domain-containing protein [Leptospira tipperaryensis]AOP36408.1 hypothetical protein A0128_20555 [Leptospira tipperaryensis]